MNIKYLCARWQGLLQQMVNLVGHGYFYYHVTVVPSEKTDSKKLEKIDWKMISKYKLDNETRNTFRYRRQKGLANFRYLRWENILIVLKTEGIVVTEDNLYKDKFNEKQIEKYMVSDPDQFSDIRHSPIFLKIGEEVSLNVQLLPKKEKGDMVTVKFSKEMFQDKKAELEEYISFKHGQRVVDTFNRLNGIPAWRGTIIQKRALKRFVVCEAKKHGLTINEKDLFVGASRKKEDNIFIK